MAQLFRETTLRLLATPILTSLLGMATPSFSIAGQDPPFPHGHGGEVELKPKGHHPSQIPVGGAPAPALAPFEDAMKNFMARHGIGAGHLAIMHGGEVIYDRSFGWKNAGRTIELPADALFRIASVTKPITAAAVHKLLNAGAFEIDDPVFDLGQPGGGLLSISPFPAVADSRLEAVTVRHLLEHKGGWDQSVPGIGDLTFREIQVSDEMGLSYPPGRSATAQWLLGHPLQHSPGSTYAYSNVGYFFLGLLIEQYAGSDYLDFVREQVLPNTGCNPTEVLLGRTHEVDQDPREPVYESSDECTHVFDPSQSVLCPYGGWDHEARVSTGRIVTSARAMLHFLDDYVVIGENIGKPLAQHNGTRSHTGGVRGTSSLARQRSDGNHYVVFFNRKGDSLGSKIRRTLDPLVDVYLGDGNETPLFSVWEHESGDEIFEDVVEGPQPTEPSASPLNRSTPGHADLLLLGPNPARGTVALEIRARAATRARIDVLDVTGREVAAVFGGEVGEGTAVVTWDTKRTPSGVFFVRMHTSDGQTQTRRVQILN